MDDFLIFYFFLINFAFTINHMRALDNNYVYPNLEKLSQYFFYFKGVVKYVYLYILWFSPFFIKAFIHYMTDKFEEKLLENIIY